VSYTLVERTVSARPVEKDEELVFINRELVPLLNQIRTVLNAIAGDLNGANFSVGEGVPVTVLTGVGLYVRTDAPSASTVLYVSQGGVWTPVTVP
jgi:hypothetical protein